MPGKPGTGLHMKCPYCDGTGQMAMERITVGTMIFAARKRAGMTQEQLCAAVMLSRAQIANIEGGRSDVPASKLIQFAQALGCSPKDLLPG